MVFDVNIYIDESSICKISNHNDFHQLVIDLLKVCYVFKSHAENDNSLQLILWKNSELDGAKLSINHTDITFISCVNEILGTEIKRQFKNVFYNKFSKVWNECRVHSDDEFYQMDKLDVVTGQTFAECAEIILIGTYSPLVFVNKNFIQGTHATVIKEVNGSSKISIPIELVNINSNPGFWLRSNFNPLKFQYNSASTSPPTDNQTYLRDTTRYIKTSMINQGRAIYRCNLTRTLHTVDNLHSGKSAHVEVWDRWGMHLGENDLNGQSIGNVDQSKKITI